MMRAKKLPQLCEDLAAEVDELRAERMAMKYKYASVVRTANVMFETLEFAAASLENISQWAATQRESDEYQRVAERIGLDAERIRAAIARAQGKG